MGKSPYIIVVMKGKQDTILITWYKYMKKEHPRYASVYARAAILHYIQYKTYLHIGTVKYEHPSEEKQTISILKDEALNAWVEQLSAAHMNASPIVRSILRNSVKCSTDGTDFIPELIDI